MYTVIGSIGIIAVVIVVTVIVVMVSGTPIEVRNRLIRLAPNVIVFFDIIIMVNTIQQTEASQHIILYCLYHRRRQQ